jgi:hypothetical protein
MYSTDEFASLEIMSRERAVLAEREMEYWFAEAQYWFAEAEEWRQLREPPVTERDTICSTDAARSNNSASNNAAIQSGAPRSLTRKCF